MESKLAPLYGFKEQFTFTPLINNKENLKVRNHIVVCGMGGSAISVSLLSLIFPEITVTLHNTYGLPTSYDKENTLFILNSYSGNTEEILESFDRCSKEGAFFAVLSCGGALVEKAKASNVPYIELPHSSLEPRFSIGYQMIGLLSLMSLDEKITELKKRIEFLQIEKLEAEGKALAEKYKGLYPVLYASNTLYPVAYLIKAAINEGAKIPSFVNIISEANHNELQSYVTDVNVNESQHFGFLHLTSPYDHVRILKRFSVMEEIYKGRGFTVETLNGNHTDTLRIFELVLTGYFMATFLAIQKDIDPYTTPLIQEFKKRMTQ